MSSHPTIWSGAPNVHRILVCLLVVRGSWAVECSRCRSRGFASILPQLPRGWRRDRDCLELQRRLQVMLQMMHLASDASSAAWSMQKLSNCLCGLEQVPFGAWLEQGSNDHETGDHACWWRPCSRAPHRRLAETSRSRNQV